MPRAIHIRPGVGAALQIVQEGGRPLRRVFVAWPLLILVTAGSKCIQVGSRRHSVRAGGLMAVACGQEVEVTNELPARGPYEARCLSFDPDVFATLPEPTGAAAIRAGWPLAQPPEFLTAAFMRACNACDEKTGTPPAIARHQVQEVLVGLGHLGVRFDIRYLNSTAERVRRLVSADPAEGWQARRVAGNLGMSEATLRRRLECEGTGFRQVLLQVRMGSALGLLQSSELPIAQIASAAGYDSVSQFSTRFRKYFGQSPRALRTPPAK